MMVSETMQNLWLKIIDSKKNPLFWPILIFLWIVSGIYALILIVHNIIKRPRIRLSIPVISIGNLTVGGSGKTPMTSELARHFTSNDKKVGIVSSGYGRRSRADICEQGRKLADFDVDDIGDEIKMLAEFLPDCYFSISKSKGEAAAILEKKYKPDIILVDDGFQHRQLYRDYDILLIDASTNLKDEPLFPLGRRRESLRSVSRADCVILTKTNLTSRKEDLYRWLNKILVDKLIAEARFLNMNAVSKDSKVLLEKLLSKQVYFFAGIGNFDLLLSHISKIFPNLVGWHKFKDHCRYQRSDLTLIKSEGEKSDADILLTTGKDYVKMSGFDFGRQLYYLDLKVYFESGEESLYNGLNRLLEKK